MNAGASGMPEFADAFAVTCLFRQVNFVGLLQLAEKP
jgi:hypothetical protein